MAKQMAKLHFKSIVGRWFVEVFLIIAAAVCVVAVLLAIIESNLYFQRVQSVAREHAHEFSALSDSTPENLSAAAVGVCETYPYKSKLQVDVISGDGKIIASTSGFETQDNALKDLEGAKKSSNGRYLYRSETENGENIMCETTVLTDKNGEVIGAFRWTTSLTATMSKINTVIIIMGIILLSILALCAVSGFYFVKSIVRPIREVSNTARKIAMGDLKTGIETDRNDEIGELCDAVNYMATELQNADNLKNDFVSSVSHELRTPLTAIRGWGETAKSAIGSDEELVSRGLDVVLTETDRLSSLVEELLDFSRMQQGRLTVTTAPIDVSNLLKTVTDMYSELARKQGVEVSFTPPAKNSIVLGDKDRLKQVFINIIDNAVKYTEKGGLVLIVQSRDNGCVQIQIKDTGVGIPAKDIDHVKEKFYKANSTVRGSGIGLAVADEIMKQHNGLLLIESTEGVGTTATVVLPLCEEPTVDDYEPPQKTKENKNTETENEGV